MDRLTATPPDPMYAVWMEDGDALYGQVVQYVWEDGEPGYLIEEFGQSTYMLAFAKGFEVKLYSDLDLAMSEKEKINAGSN